MIATPEKTTQGWMPIRRRLKRKLHLKILHEKCPLVGGFLDDLTRRLSGAVAGAGFNPDQDWGGAGLSGCQGRSELEAVARKNAVVMIGRGNEGGGIFRAGFDVVKRRIPIDRAEFILVLGRPVIGRPGPANGKLLETQHVHNAYCG